MRMRLVWLTNFKYIHMTISKTVDHEENIHDQIKERNFDITPFKQKAIKVYINGEECISYEGEKVLTTLLAYGFKKISKNNHNQLTSAYCGMGICFCCMVFINGSKKRACKTIVQEGMHIDTLMNNEDVVNENDITIKNISQ